MPKKKTNPLKDPVTISEPYNLDGSLSQSQWIEIPDCGISSFLVHRVVASPEPTDTNPAVIDPTLGLWFVRIPTLQRSLPDTDIGAPIHLWGTGYQTKSVSLDPGQATFDGDGYVSELGSIHIQVEIVEGNIGLQHKFNVHVGGQCADPFFTQVPANTD